MAEHDSSSRFGADFKAGEAVEHVGEGLVEENVHPELEAGFVSLA